LLSEVGYKVGDAIKAEFLYNEMTAEQKKKFLKFQGLIRFFSFYFLFSLF
jgi:hypothetical protein